MSLPGLHTGFFGGDVYELSLAGPADDGQYDVKYSELPEEEQAALAEYEYLEDPVRIRGEPSLDSGDVVKIDDEEALPEIAKFSAKDVDSGDYEPVAAVGDEFEVHVTHRSDLLLFPFIPFLMFAIGVSLIIGSRVRGP